MSEQRRSTGIRAKQLRSARTGTLDFRQSRVLVPADVFYERKPLAGQKQPYLIHMKDREPFRMGGLLEFWQGSAGEVATFTILTTAPNTLMAEIHNRMRSSSGPRPTPSGSALAPVTSIDCIA